MRDYPLLDLRDDWKDVTRALTNVDAVAEALFCDSDHTWTEMELVRAKVQAARDALGTLPPGILDGIAQDEADLDEADLDEAEANAYTGY